MFVPRERGWTISSRNIVRPKPSGNRFSQSYFNMTIIMIIMVNKMRLAQKNKSLNNHHHDHDQHHHGKAGCC